MLDQIVMTAVLSWGSETIDTPRFGEIDAHINQQTITFNYDNWVVGVQELSINPEVSQKVTAENVFVGYQYKGLTGFASDDMWGVSLTYPVVGDLYVNGSYVDRDYIDRASIGVGYQFTDNIAMQINYGTSDYVTGAEGKFTAASFVIKY